MNVILNPELETLVNNKVRSGEFPTAEAVVEEGLRLLKARDRAESRLELCCSRPRIAAPQPK
jgi:putative addiction module CopG family antidote